MPELFDRNITVPGFSTQFPDAHCVADGSICQLTTAMGEINAASTLMALLFSPSFNLSSTYFLLAGIGGINPYLGTLASVTMARYAVQFDLTHEFDARQIPSNWSTGLVPQGAKVPTSYTPAAYPQSVYGTEAFELNDALKKRFVGLLDGVELADSEVARAYRARYGFAPANEGPGVVECDSGTSNPYWSGSKMADAFGEYMKLLTNGTGKYCNTQQEDNATLESLLRGHLMKRVDFSRIAILRTGSNFDRAPPGVSTTDHLLHMEQGGFAPAIENIWRAGRVIVKDIVKNWEGVYKGGIKTDNYVGDVLNRVGGTPDIG
ncbi:purine nucleoside permease [Corynespora cassiicola Philippines]|uniref:Purine nucleoside permease n=1 Tax=Corynespora cassiicola Philippines TaxID=1448308 RepID=A0A2T2N9T5_CORCC|nr:purine nucleoside permease [Corynespora cassiicola Philippines]